MKQKSIAVDLWDFLFNLIYFIMKVFITNKKYFEEAFDDSDRFLNTKRAPLNSRQIHKLVYNKLSNSLAINHSIPVCILVPYDNGEGSAIFDFINKKEDVYFYEYATTVS